MRWFTACAGLVAVICGGSVNAQQQSYPDETINEQAFFLLYPEISFKKCSKVSAISVTDCEKTKKFVLLMGHRLWRAKNIRVLFEWSNKIELPSFADKFDLHAEYRNLNKFYISDGIRFSSCLENKCAEVFELNSITRELLAQRWQQAILFNSCIYNAREMAIKKFHKPATDAYVFYRSLNLANKYRNHDKESRKKLQNYCVFPGIDREVIEFSLNNLPKFD